MLIDWNLREENGGWLVETVIRTGHEKLTIDDLDAIATWLRTTREHFKVNETETVSAETVKATQVAKSPAKNRNGSKPKAEPVAAVTVVAPELTPETTPDPGVELETNGSWKTQASRNKSSQSETILAYLSEKGSSTVNRIAQGTGIPQSSVGALMSVLLRKGTVRVASDTFHEGRPIKTYALNENGHELVTQP